MKPLVCIFAHPDDEAFGPAGSIAKFAKQRDVYIICVTNGDAGQNSIDELADLGEIRKKELIDSAKVLGVKDVFFLGYKDGNLANNLYHEIARKIEEKLNDLQPDTLLTFDLLGISGHIDHIAVSLITTFVFKRLDFISQLYYYGEINEVIEEYKDYFIYMPPGFKKDEIDLTIDVSENWDVKQKAMNCHQSQKKDAQMIKDINSKYPKEEYFKKFIK